MDGLTANKTFVNISQKFLTSICLPPASYIEFKDMPIEKLVFVTATSSNHYKESHAAVASVQKYFPNHTIMYDIGLSQGQAQEVSCSLQYNFNKLNFYSRFTHQP